MNIVNKVTLKHMKQNKKRTLVTIIGVIISTAMITAVITLGVSFMDLMVKETISSSGLWHLAYHDVPAENIPVIEEDEGTEAIHLIRDLGFAPLAESTNRNRPYLNIMAYDDSALENFPFTLIEGRLPEAEGEMLVTDYMREDGEVALSLGDTVTYEIGYRKSLMEADEEGNPRIYDSEVVTFDSEGEMEEEFVKTGEETYRIVGIIEVPYFEYSWAPAYSAVAYLEQSSLDRGDICTVYTVQKKPAAAMFSRGEELEAESGASRFQGNSVLLRYMGVIGDDSLRKTLFVLTAIIMTIIVIGSISLIYNAFAISVSERSRYLGMLSSIGATGLQKKNSVFFEGLVIGAVSIPIGFLSGILGIQITLMAMNTILNQILNLNNDFTVKISALSIIGTLIFSLLTIMISAFIPARRASKMSSMDAIRQSQDVKLSAKKVKTWRITRKLFGLEGEIALKNLKRNKRRYQATVFSLVISLVLFISATYFGQTLSLSLDMAEGDLNYDLSVYVSYEGEEAAETAAQILALEKVSEGTYVRRIPAPAEGWDTLNNIEVYALDDESLKRYAEEVGADFDRLKDEDIMSCIAISKITYQDEDLEKYVTTDIIGGSPGDSLEIYSTNYDDVTDEESYQLAGELSMDYYTDVLPMGITQVHKEYLCVVVSVDVQEKLKRAAGDSLFWEYRNLYIDSDDPLGLQKDIEELEINGISIYNLHKQRQQQDQLMLLMGVFVYGFITLITVICAANIFNTISTSIALRKREFAMLRSVGMTPGGFSRMIRYESIFYGLKTLLYGIPISLGVIYLIYRGYGDNFQFPFRPPWFYIGCAVAAVFLVVGMTMLYSGAKIKNENIIDALKQETA